MMLQYVVRNLRDGRLDVGYTAHPSFVTSEELSAIDKPLSIAAAGKRGTLEAVHTFQLTDLNVRNRHHFQPRTPCRIRKDLGQSAYSVADQSLWRCSAWLRGQG